MIGQGYVIDKEYRLDGEMDDKVWSMNVAQDVAHSLADAQLKADVSELYEIILSFVTHEEKRDESNAEC